MTYLGSALLTAILFNLASAPFNQAYLVFAAFIPLLALRNARWSTRLLTGWLAGWLMQAMGYYWVFYTIRDFGGLSNPISGIGAALFQLYQGADLGLWLLLAPMLANRLPLRLQPLVYAAYWSVIQSDLYPYVFPWNLGAILVNVPVLSQGAVLWSTHGLGFFTVLVQATIWLVLIKGPRRKWDMPAVAAVLLIWVAPGLVWRTPASSETWRVGVVQPNLIPWAKNGAMSFDEIYNAHLRPSLELKDKNLDLLVWPETAMSIDLAESPHYKQALISLSKELNAPLITGTLGETEDIRLTNEMWMIDPNGGIQTYAKEKLVIFSEQLPWIFGWARYFDSGIGAFAPGRENKVFVWRDKQIVPLVCFEALFARYVRGYQGHMMVNLTNDAWFGETKASWQHLQQIQLRAVENRVPLIRCTNSGISCWVDTAGKIHDTGGLYEAETFVFEVPVQGERGPAVSGYGAWTISILSWLLIIAAMGFKRQRNGPSSNHHKARRDKPGNP